jgi:Flp pilus assembly protein TadD
VVVGGKERRTTAVLADDRQTGVAVVAVDLPDGAPPALRAEWRPPTGRRSAHAIDAEGRAQEIVVAPAAAVPGLGLVCAVEAGGTPASGSAVVSADGELVGAALTGDAPGGGVAFIVPASRLLSMPRVGPVPVVEWSLQARAERSPEAARARLGGAAAALAGRLEEAAAAFDAVVTADPSARHAWTALADSRRTQGGRGASIDVLRRAVAAQPANAKFHHQLAIDLSDEGDHTQAATEFAEVARLRPADPEAHFNLGVALAQVGRLEDEYKAYQAALAIDPGHVRALRNLGVSCLALKRNDEAVTSFTRAGRLAPADPEIQTGLGISYLTLKRVRDAVDVLRNALRLAPALGKAHFWLGTAYVASGDLSAARAECDALRAIDKRQADQLCRMVDAK